MTEGGHQTTTRDRSVHDEGRIRELEKGNDGWGGVRKIRQVELISMDGKCRRRLIPDTSPKLHVVGSLVSFHLRLGLFESVGICFMCCDSQPYSSKSNCSFPLPLPLPLPFPFPD